MLSLFRTRAKARALFGAAVAGAGLCAIVGCASQLGGQAQAAAGTFRPEPLAAAVTPAVTAASPGALAPAAPPAPRPVPAVALPLAAAPVHSTPIHTMDEPVSASDLDCLAAAVYYEARGEPADGQAAVAQVVLNRARAPSYPKNVCGVVYQGVAGHECQFSFACNGAMRRAREPAAWTRARDIAERALHGYVMAAVGRATCFHAARLGGGEGRVIRLGGHVFFGGAGRGQPADAYRTVSLTHAVPAGPDRPHMTFALGVLAPAPVTTRAAPSPSTAPAVLTQAATPPSPPRTTLAAS